MTVTAEAERLRAAAAAVGVQPGWWDVRGQWQEVGLDVLAHVAGVAAGLGPLADAPTPVAEALEEAAAATDAGPLAPTVVCWLDEAPHVVVRLPAGVDRAELRLAFDLRSGRAPAEATVDLAAEALSVGQRAGRRAWRIELAPLLGDAGLPVGRHRLGLAAGGAEAEAVVLAAPRRVVGLGADERLWGVVAPAWSLWTRARPDAHLGHLGQVAEWIDALGGQVVATLPLLATYLADPCDPSPYTPVSRRWWNEAYLDLAARPELRDCPAALDVLAGAPPVPGPDPYDAPARARVVRAAIGHLADHVATTDGPLRHDLEAFAADQPVRGYARFRAAVERTGTGWHAWPGDGSATVAAVPDDDPAVRAHVYAQWAMGRQLGRLTEVMGRRGQRLQLDLPVGTHADGWDTFARRDAFGWGASVGAPPDDFFTEGQDWGFPPLLPGAGRADGHAVLAECLAAHMAVAGLLRIDHAMQLQRLYWVPDGASAEQGTYVHQPIDELVATVAVESHLAGCAVVGEDLGTVSDEVRSAMADHGVAGMWVAQFEPCDDEGRWHRPPRADQVASITTHDTPTFAGWARADDVDRSVALGVLDPSVAEDHRSGRRHAVQGLLRRLHADGLLDEAVVDPAASSPDAVATHAALARRLGATDAAVVLVALDDLEGVVEPLNVPGTPVDRPNWVLRSPRPLTDLVADARLQADLAGLADARRSATPEGA